MARTYVQNADIHTAAAALMEYSGSESESDDEPPANANHITCGGPCQSRYPPEAMVRCEAGHPVCLNDAKRYTASQIDSSVPALKCLTKSCEKRYPGTEVLRLINLDIFAGRGINASEAIIANFGVVDLLEICRYCETVVVCGPIAATTATQCTNPRCKKLSCRKCKKLSHGDTTCSEAYKQSNECGKLLRDFPPGEIARCEDGHPFSLEAAKEYVAGQKGIPVLKCLDSVCDKIFPGKEVLRFIDLKMFKGLPRETLEAMIVRVGVADLVSICPNCLTVVECGPIEKSIVVNCTDPNCKKSTCRKCAKDSHGEISCEEYEKGKIRAAMELLVTVAIHKESVRASIEGLIAMAIHKEIARRSIEKDDVRRSIEGLITMAIGKATVRGDIEKIIIGALL